MISKLKEKPKSHFQRVQITIRNTKRNEKDLNAKQHSSLLCKRKEADLITLYDVAEISNNLFLFYILMMESKEENFYIKSINKIAFVYLAFYCVLLFFLIFV